MPLFEGTTGNYYEGPNNTFNNGDEDYGNYQFTSLQVVIDQFMLAYVGEDKIISKIKRPDVVFHAQRALQELSFDTFKSTKAQEVVVPATLQIPLPHDYVNYVKITFTDASGIEHLIHPARITSNPQKITQGADGSYTLSGDEIQTSDSETWSRFQNQNDLSNIDYDYITDYDTSLYDSNQGQRFGLDPQFAQVNGTFYIDELKGKIHFSSNMSGNPVTIKYISDSLGTEAEMQVHKFAEEAMYKYIAHAVLATRANTPEYLVDRYKREARAAKRQAKLRLSNIKLEEITQVLRGKSKQIKH
jgi:hypothetical protein